jgi:hypothetical protein
LFRYRPLPPRRCRTRCPPRGSTSTRRASSGRAGAGQERSAYHAASFVFVRSSSAVCGAAHTTVLTGTARAWNERDSRDEERAKGGKGELYGSRKRPHERAALSCGSTTPQRRPIAAERVARTDDKSRAGESRRGPRSWLGPCSFSSATVAPSGAFWRSHDGIESFEHRRRRWRGCGAGRRGGGAARGTSRGRRCDFGSAR